MVAAPHTPQLSAAGEEGAVTSQQGSRPGTHQAKEGTGNQCGCVAPDTTDTTNNTQFLVVAFFFSF